MELLSSYFKGSAIAAVNSTDHLRVYFQDVQGNIRESLYESGWANGTINNVIATGKIGSPIAATSKELNAVTTPYIAVRHNPLSRVLDPCLLRGYRQQSPRGCLRRQQGVVRR